MVKAAQRLGPEVQNVAIIGSQRVDIASTLRAISKSECEEDLAAFVQQSWHIIEPSQPFVHGWHIDFLCAHLEAITDGIELDDGSAYNRLLINVPPGPGWVENLVMTDNGRVRLGDIRPGDMVLTHKGRFRNVSACYSKGMLDTLVVKTRSGREMVLTPDHNVLTPNGWVEARHLAVGSTLAVVTPETGLANDLVSPEEARLLGYLIGDGSITQATVSFTNHDADTVEDFERCATTVGFATKRGDRGVVRVHGGIKVHEWLEGYGLFRASSYDKHIPAAILKSSNRIIQNFIGAYWSCDGMFDVRPTVARGSSYRASATTVSKRLADDLLHALTRIGIRSVLRPKARKLDTAAQPGGVYRSYNIEVYAEEDTARFIDMPGLSIRKNALARMCAKRRFDSILMEDTVIKIIPGGERECMCVSVDEDHSLSWSDIAVHNTMKSLLVGVFWPSWEWGPKKMAHMRYVCASHSLDLAIRDGLRMRRLITSEWYQKRWGDRVQITSDQNQKTKFENTATGFRQAAAAGSITGSRGDRVIIDDPHSTDGANSDQQRESTTLWYQESVTTRLNNPDKSAIVCVMQRLHGDDVSGVILDKQLGYDHVMLPMEYDPRRAMPTLLGLEDPRKTDGELLFPQRFPADVVERDKRVMGPYATAGQFQQEPAPRGGGVIKSDWWSLWPRDAYPPMDYIVASIDTAYTTKTENDYSAMTVWGIFSGDLDSASADNWSDKDGNRRSRMREASRFDEGLRIKHLLPDDPQSTPRVMLMQAWQERLELADLVAKIAKTCKTMKVDKLLVEGKASGLSVAQELRRLYGHEDWAVQLINPGSIDKLARIYSVQHLFSEGMIHAPDRSWADMVIRQCEIFPKGKHDDLVDTVSQALRHMRETGLLVRAPERIAEIDAGRRHRGGEAAAPLYPV